MPQSRKTINDLNPGDVIPNCLRAISLGAKRIRAAFMFSDENWEIGAGAIFDIDLQKEGPVEPIYGYTDFFMDYIWTSGQNFFLETGCRIHSDIESRWTQKKFEASFLRAFGKTSSGVLFCCGDNGEVFRQTGTEWVHENTDCSASILAIHGNKNGKSCGVGAQGSFIQRSHDRWSKHEVGLGNELRAVHVYSDGSVLIGGTDATLAKLWQGELSLIEADELGDIMALTQYKKQTFISDSMVGLSTIDNGVVTPILNCGFAGRLDVSCEILSVAAGEMIFAFDGSKWLGCRIVFDGGIRSEFVDLSTSLL